jgi:6-phosphogluconolactonase (cycloisomerase 2 family)
MTQVPYFPSPANPATGQPLSVPAGVAVDPCDRFVYVANHLTNTVSAYTICNGKATQSTQNCPQSPLPPDGSLVAVGPPVSLSGGANGPGQILVDPFGNYVYVLDMLSNHVSTLKIGSVSGSLTVGNPAVVQTGGAPAAMAIRGDDSWLFVTNFGSATLSQFSITPATGALNPLFTTTTTDNQPFGLAVK